LILATKFFKKKIFELKKPVHGVPASVVLCIASIEKEAGIF
jgi:hypothetical protein